MKKYIINDVPDVDCSILALLEQEGVVILEIQKMNQALFEWEGWSYFSKKTTRIFFPGNGAYQVFELFGQDFFHGWRLDFLKASRFCPAWGSPVAVVSLAFPGECIDSRTEDVIVVDDVISSGATMRVVKERHRVWLPRARWHALSWVAQRSTVLKGFASFEAVEWVGDKQLKSPINSLSTLLTEAKVAEIYVRRNFPHNHEAVLAALQSAA